MNYKDNVIKCLQILKENELPTKFLYEYLPVMSTNELLSYTDGEIVCVGLLTRVSNLFTKDSTTHSILHELLHLYVDTYPPTKREMKAFGTQREWSLTQKFSSMLKTCIPDEFVSRYSQTHPLEDFVETAKYILLDKENIPHKKEIDVTTWLDRVRELV